MKPAPFAYHAPESLDEAISLLGELGDEARPLAGGQSLLPLMNLRLAQPSALIDLNRVQGLSEVKVNGSLSIGCMTRHATVCKSPEVAKAAPLLQSAMLEVGHPAIRARGTLGGSIAHADPSAEAALSAVVLGAELVVAGPQGQRVIPAEDFFVGPFMTTLQEGEVLIEARFPLIGDTQGWSFHQVARAHGDFALVGAAATMTLEGDKISQVRVAVAGASDRPLLVESVATELSGKEADGDLFKAVAEQAGQDLKPSGDSHASADYRKDVAGVLIKRALNDALASAQGKG